MVQFFLITLSIAHERDGHRDGSEEITLALSWLMIFSRRASIVPSFISDSNTSSGVITEEDDIFYTEFTKFVFFKFRFKIYLRESITHRLFIFRMISYEEDNRKQKR